MTDEEDIRMPIKLQIEISSPLDADDHELLSGIAVMTLAVANHELAKAKFPEAFGDDEPSEEPVAPAPCGMEDDAGGVCVGNVGHRGRHRFRPVVSLEADTSLVN
jgi:hypothetical protein